MNPDNFFSYITTATTALVTNHGALFDSMGLNLFRGIAIIILSWFGVQSALASISGHGLGFRLDRFAGLLMTLAFGYAMIHYYTQPIPGIGRSFASLITDEGLTIAAQIEESATENISAEFTDLILGTQPPSGNPLWTITEWLRYYAVTICSAVAQAAVTFVIAFGFIALAIFRLVGPLFIPFFIVPHMEWMFWGWLKGFIQYAFYPVVANCFVYVFGQFAMGWIHQHPSPWDATMIAQYFLQFLMMVIAFIWGVLKMPAVVSSLFSGRSGDHAFPGIGWWR